MIRKKIVMVPSAIADSVTCHLALGKLAVTEAAESTARIAEGATHNGEAKEGWS